MTANGVTLHIVSARPSPCHPVTLSPCQPESPLIVLLHGFPECWYSWRHQIPALAEAGFRVVAPDMRGYNLSEKPESGYDVDTLAGDVVGLIDHFGSERAVVAGHDWGGAVAWWVALRHRERVEKLIALNIPHPALFARGLLRNPRQMLRSSYIAMFQVPGLAERFFRANDYAAIEQAIRGMAVHPERFTDADIRVYKEAARQPGALTAALQYYRSLRPGQLRRLARGGDALRVTVPTLMIWGEQDAALGKELTEGTEEFVPDLTLHFLPDASHWVQQDEPERVTEMMLEFLRRPTRNS